MFLHLSVILFTGGMSAPVHARIHLPGSRHPLGADNSPRTPPSRWPLLRMVHILLKCILFYDLFLQDRGGMACPPPLYPLLLCISFQKQFLNKISRIDIYNVMVMFLHLSVILFTVGGGVSQHASQITWVNKRVVRILLECILVRTKGLFTRCDRDYDLLSKQKGCIGDSDSESDVT